MKYNSSQLEAINHIDGPCLVLAGAGSGKTRVITGRIENLIKNRNIPPKNILAVTFTNKAAKEMNERIDEELREKANGLTCTTFHALCVRILKQDIDKIGFKKNFSIYTSSEQIMLIKKSMHELKIEEELFDPQLVMWKISKYKSLNQSYNEIVITDPLSSVAKRVYEVYQALLKESNAVDFDDLLNHTLDLFIKFPNVLEKFQRYYKYILVDEFQDTNITQYNIIKKISEKDKNLFVVGDDDQSIYGFRGANYENILSFDRDWKGCKTIVLDVNYRSTKTILDAASNVIANNKYRKNKDVSAFNNDNGMNLIDYFEAFSQKDEVIEISENIFEQIGSNNKKFKDFAVLIRANYLSREIEEVFREKNISYKLVGGMKFYDRKEIKDLVAYMTIVNNPSDEVSMLRIINTPRRGLGDETIFKISSYAKKNHIKFYDALKQFKKIETIGGSSYFNIEKFVILIDELLDFNKNNPSKIKELLSLVIAKTNYITMLNEMLIKKSFDAKLKKAIEFKKENIDELLNSVSNYEKEVKSPSLEKYLDKISLVQDSDEIEDKNNSVNIMTVHSSKGLEFDTVFISSFEDGIFPHERSIEEGNIEEERRLFYVAITRAKNKLFISNCNERKRYGKSIKTKRSRFLKEIPNDLFTSSPELSKKKNKEKAKNNIEDLIQNLKNTFSKDN